MSDNTSGWIMFAMTEEELRYVGKLLGEQQVEVKTEGLVTRMTDEAEIFTRLYMRIEHALVLEAMKRGE